MSIENLHLITIPFYGRHTGLAMFEMFTRLFDALCPLWRDKLIGCSTDGPANMTGNISGFVTRIQNVVRPNFVRVWCLLHQIDIVMQNAYKNSGCGLYKCFTSLIAFLRRQKLLIDQMRAVCPSVSATPWASMSRVARFVTERRSEIMSYLEESGATESLRDSPSPGWWIVMAVVSEISSHVSECVTILQGRRGTLQQQKNAVQELLNAWSRLNFDSEKTSDICVLA